MFWNFVTDLGDSAVTLPLATLAFLFLLLSHWRRLALKLAFSVLACALGIGLLKLLFESCGRQLLDANLTNPSGHVAMSTNVYGSLALLLGFGQPTWRRWLLAGGAALLIGVVAVSRVVLESHTPAEVLSGLAVGLVTLALFYRATLSAPMVDLEVRWLALLAVLLVAVMHGSRWPLEDAVRSIVQLIRHSVPRCA